MSNRIYDAYLDDIERGGSPWLTGGLTVALVNNSTAFSNVNLTWGDISGGAIGGQIALGSKYVTTPGHAGGGTVTFSGISSLLIVGAIVLYCAGAPLGDRLMIWWDTVVGLPLTTNGADITVDWNGTAPTGDILIATGPPP